MTLTIELTSEEEAQLVEAAQREGLEAAEYARRLLAFDLAVMPMREKGAARPLTARELLKLPQEEQDRYLRAAAELAAPEYEADLALPPHARELTAISAVAGADFMEEPADE